MWPKTRQILNESHIIIWHVSYHQTYALYLTMLSLKKRDSVMADPVNLIQILNFINIYKCLQFRVNRADITDIEVS